MSEAGTPAKHLILNMLAHVMKTYFTDHEEN